MNWQIKPFSHRCSITGEPFEDGARYASYLVQEEGDRELSRFDVGAEEEARFQPPGEVLCRWSREYRKESGRENPAKRQKESAESLFFSLFESEDEEDDRDRETMKQVLGVYLERKRILKDRGFAREGAVQVMEHRKSGNVFLVPTGHMTPESLLRIQEKLGEWIG